MRAFPRLAVALLLRSAPLLASRPLPAQPAARPVGGAAMARIPGGRFTPLYGGVGAGVRIATFRLAATPVTRGEFLAFVTLERRWRRSQVARVFAEPGYLADWQGDLDAHLAPVGPRAGAADAADLRRPVTGVSWLAARAYCAWRGDRLPSTDEWEWAAMGAGRRPAPARLLALYTAPRPHPLPVVGSGWRTAEGVADLHGRAWEWTADFNAVLVSDDSREVGSGVRARDHGLYCAAAALGATDPADYPAFLRAAFRAGITGRTTVGSLGFRCAHAA